MSGISDASDVGLTSYWWLSPDRREDGGPPNSPVGKPDISCSSEANSELSNIPTRSKSLPSDFKTAKSLANWDE